MALLCLVFFKFGFALKLTDMHLQLPWSANVHTRACAHPLERVGFAGVNLCTDGRLSSVTGGLRVGHVGYGAVEIRE